MKKLVVVAMLAFGGFGQELRQGGGEHWVRDVWRDACEGKHSGNYVVTVPPHATKLIYVKSVACAKCE